MKEHNRDPLYNEVIDNLGDKISIEILTKVLPKKDLKINLEKALRLSSPAFGDEASWGKIEKKIVSTFLNWIYEKGLERVKIPIDQLITNKLLS